jgi:hypothetical protein
VFATNHLLHFYFVFQNFKSHSITLSIAENIHGFITFISILIIPIILWSFKKLNKVLYFSIILYLFNVSYFINETFLSKVKPDKPAYHNQFGIVVITAACLFVFYRVVRESKSKYSREIEEIKQGGT